MLSWRNRCSRARPQLPDPHPRALQCGRRYQRPVAGVIATSCRGHRANKRGSAERFRQVIGGDAPAVWTFVDHLSCRWIFFVPEAGCAGSSSRSRSKGPATSASHVDIVGDMLLVGRCRRSCSPVTAAINDGVPSLTDEHRWSRGLSAVRFYETRQSETCLTITLLATTRARVHGTSFFIGSATSVSRSSYPSSCSRDRTAHSGRLRPSCRATDHLSVGDLGRQISKNGRYRGGYPMAAC